MITTPLYLFVLATQKVGNDLDSVDFAFAQFLPLCVVFEWFADGQQWSKCERINDQPTSNAT